MDSPSQLSDAPGAESDSGEEEGQEEEEEEEEEFGEAGGEEAAGEEAEEEDGGIIIARKGGRPSGGGRKRTGKSLAAAERAAAGEPKRAQNGYMFWSQTARAQVRAGAACALTFTDTRLPSPDAAIPPPTQPPPPPMRQQPTYPHALKPCWAVGAWRLNLGLERASAECLQVGG